jgi:hypothetical protein
MGLYDRRGGKVACRRDGDKGFAALSYAVVDG